MYSGISEARPGPLGRKATRVEKGEWIKDWSASAEHSGNVDVLQTRLGVVKAERRLVKSVSHVVGACVTCNPHLKRSRPDRSFHQICASMFGDFSQNCIEN